MYNMNKKFYAMMIIWLYKKTNKIYVDISLINELINLLHDNWLCWFNDLYQSTIDSTYKRKYSNCDDMVYNFLQYHYDLNYND